MASKILYVIRGAPGSGKSTLAEAMLLQGLVQGHVEADYYFMNNGKYEFDAKKLYDAHNWCRKEARRLLEEGYSVVVSNTFSRDEEVMPYYNMAAETNALYQEVILWEVPFENTHKVPEDKVQAYQARLHKQFK